MGKHKKVLLIDDDNLIYTVMKRTLDTFKSSLIDTIDLHYCNTIRDGINLIKSKGVPDLILIDYYISGETCEYFLEWLRDNKVDIPVDVVTSIRDYPTLRKLINMGVGRVMYKPVSWEGMIENINTRIQTKNKEFQDV